MHDDNRRVEGGECQRGAKGSLQPSGAMLRRAYLYRIMAGEVRPPAEDGRPAVAAVERGAAAAPVAGSSA